MPVFCCVSLGASDFDRAREFYEALSAELGGIIPSGKGIMSAISAAAQDDVVRIHANTVTNEVEPIPPKKRVY